MLLCVSDAESSLQKTEGESGEKGVDMEPLGDPDHIKHLLEAISTAQQQLSANVKQQRRTSGRYATVARRLDAMFAVLYLITAVLLLSYIFTEMTKD